MANLETKHAWTYAAAASTGGAKAFNCQGYAQQLTAYIETGAGCTATIRMESRAGSSAGPYATLTSTSLTTSQCVLQSFNGPVEWVRPYVTSKSTGDLFITLIGN